MHKIKVSLLLFLALATLAQVHAATSWPDVAQYPALDDTQLGHVAFIVQVAHRAGGDWSQMNQDEPGQGGFDSYRYQLAMMSYTLNLANYHYTPAYRELYQDSTARLIDKMLRMDVWGFWELTSRGAKIFNPDMTELGQGWIDPVRHQNIMYSGHLFQMVNTYEMLYDDPKYEAADAIRFIYDPVGRGLGKQEFDYSNQKLADVLYKGFEENDWKGIECEPNAIFTECQQHPILGFELFDQRHKTHYFKTVGDHFKGQLEAMQYVDPKTNSFMGFYQVQQKRVVYYAAPWSDGWAGSFMHAWDKAQIEKLYPTQRDNYLAKLSDGTETISIKKPRGSYSHDHGFMAVLAAEMGDTETRDKLLAYADKYWSPTWADGALHYPRHDSFAADENADTGANPADVWYRVQVLTGNALLGLARLDPKDGMYTLYSRPWTAEHFREPYVSGVSYPAALVRRAVYDARAEALIVTLKPGPRAQAGAGLHWRAKNLNPKMHYAVWQDGKSIAEIKAGTLVRGEPGGTVSVADDGETLVVNSALDSEHTFAIIRDHAK